MLSQIAPCRRWLKHFRCLQHIRRLRTLLPPLERRSFQHVRLLSSLLLLLLPLLWLLQLLRLQLLLLPDPWVHCLQLWFLALLLCLALLLGLRLLPRPTKDLLHLMSLLACLGQ
jgi:hypothetical protein